MIFAYTYKNSVRLKVLKVRNATLYDLVTATKAVKTVYEYTKRLVCPGQYTSNREAYFRNEDGYLLSC
jgi:hypothetical protein